MPLSLGYGLKNINKYNAVLLCKKCNNKKSNFLPTKFYTSSQLKILETTYNIQTHKNIDIDGYKNIDIENIIDLYENSLKNKNLLYLDYLDYLWNQEKISKYKLKKNTFYKFYCIKGGSLQIIYGKIKYNFFLGQVVIDSIKIKLKDIKGITLWN